VTWNYDELLKALDQTPAATRWQPPFDGRTLNGWRIEPSGAPHKSYWNAAGWNRVRPVCEGPRAGLQGHFALQLHARDELRIRYRNIHVRPLS